MPEFNTSITSTKHTLGSYEYHFDIGTLGLISAFYGYQFIYIYILSEILTEMTKMHIKAR